MNKEQLLAIIQGGHLTDGDLADAILAELVKVQEPVGFIAHNPGGYYDGCHIPAAPYNFAEFYGEMPTAGTKFYLNPLPQPDLVAEIERLKVLSVNNIMLDVVPGDGSGQEVYAKSVDDVVMALTRLSEKAEDLFSTERRLESYIKEAEKLRQQLSAAQASEDELLNALETLACLGNGNCYGNSHGNVIAQQAIATHKARKEGK